MVRVVNLRTHAYTVYGGRAGHGKPGPYGNPFIVGRDGQRGECVKLFTEWFHSDAGRSMRELAEKSLTEHDVLGCFCKPQTCHCDTIAAHVNKVHNWK